MTLRITIDVFSGRPNPVLELSGHEEKEVLSRLRRTKRATECAAPRTPLSTLGYRGLQFELGGGRKSKTLPQSFRVIGGNLVGPRGRYPIIDPALEEFVCGTGGLLGPLRMGPRFPEYCLEEIRRLPEILAKYPWKKWPWPRKDSCKCAPLWEPSWWNDGGQVQHNNNCYNYGTNYRSDTYAQPGKAAGSMYTSLTCAAVRPAAVADDLIAKPSANNKCPSEGHLVALVVGPGWDFHWYRKGRNGKWTHKPGGTAATNLDNSGNLITDPRTADRGGYTDFCTFMVVMHGHIKIM